MSILQKKTLSQYRTKTCFRVLLALTASIALLSTVWHIAAKHSFVFAQSGSIQEYPVNPYVDPSQASTNGVPIYKYGIEWLSFVKQPWRAYQATVAGTDFLNGIGVNYSSGIDKDQEMRLLSEAGYKNVRTNFTWGYFNWNENGWKDANTAASEQALLAAMKKYNLRPMIMLDAYQGIPAPYQQYTYNLVNAAGVGATQLKLSSVTGLVANFSGLDGLSVNGDYTMARYIFTNIDSTTNTVTLSKALPVALSAGKALTIETLKYQPFYNVGSSQFDATMAGYLKFVKFAIDQVKAAGITDFDVETWNEIGFGTDFLNINNYYDSPIVPPDAHALEPGVGGRQNGYLWEIGARDAQFIAQNYPGTPVVQGFYNYVGQNVDPTTLPPGTDGITYHPYSSNYFNHSQPYRNSTVNGNYDYIGRNLGLFHGALPTNLDQMLPESNMMEQTSNLSVQHRFNPEYNQAPNVPPGKLKLNYYFTEHGFMLHDTNGLDASTVPESTKWNLKAKSLLRIMTFWLGKVGIKQMYTFQAHDDIDGYGVMPATINANGTDASNTSPAMAALHNLTAQLAGSQPLAATRTLEFKVSSIGTQYPIFIPTDPTLQAPYYRDMFVASPIQIADHKFAIPLYYMSYNLAHPPTSDGMQFRFAVQDLHSSAPLAVSYYDPLTGTTIPVTATKNGDGSYGFAETASTTSSLTIMDYPRLLIVSEDASASGTPPPIPSAVVATAQSNDVNLTWTASAGAAAYRVFRNDVLLGTTSNSSFHDTNLPPVGGQTAIYRVQAYDSVGNLSDYSANGYLAGGFDSQNPSLPGNVTYSLRSDGKVTVAWTAATDNSGIDHYTLIRDGQRLAFPTGIPGNQTAFVDAPGVGSHLYYMKVSDYSGNESGTTTYTTVVVPSPSGVCLKVALEGRQVGALQHPHVMIQIRSGNVVVGTQTVTASTDGTVRLDDPAIVTTLTDSASYTLWVKPQGYLAQSFVGLVQVLATCHDLTVSQFKAGDFSLTDDNTETLGDFVSAINSFNSQHSGITLVIDSEVYLSGVSLANLVDLIRTFNIGPHGDI